MKLKINFNWWIFIGWQSRRKGTEKIIKKLCSVEWVNSILLIMKWERNRNTYLLFKSIRMKYVDRKLNRMWHFIANEEIKSNSFQSHFSQLFILFFTVSIFFLAPNRFQSMMMMIKSLKIFFSSLFVWFCFEFVCKSNGILKIVMTGCFVFISIIVQLLRERSCNLGSRVFLSS